MRFVGVPALLDLPMVGPIVVARGDHLWRGVRVIANTDPLTPLANYGALGVMVIAFMLGLVYGRPTMERALADLDKANARTELAIERFAAIEAQLDQVKEAIAEGAVRAAQEREANRQLAVRNIIVLENLERAGWGRQ